MSVGNSAARNGARARRGQPLLALVAILLGWGGVRAALWEPLVAEAPAAFAGLAHLAAHPAGPDPRKVSAPQVVPLAAPSAAPHWPAAPLAASPAQTVADAPSPGLGTIGPDRASAGQAPITAPAPAAPAPAPLPPAPQFMSARVAGGHQLLWLAALGQLPMPAVLAERREADAPAPRLAAPLISHWSADGWLLWRRGSAGAASPQASLALPSGTYGASQLGAVIRYRLAPASAHRPAFYLRATSALNSPHGEEAALGLALRPLAGVPVSAMAELRATHFASGTVARPAAALVSELPRLKLPLGLEADTYAQAGYVGGRGASAFVDAQMRIERPLVRAGRLELRAGGGAWGGAQKGANRLDLGPSASLGLPLGPGGSHLSADWRFRVAGDAAPGSGPAITLSAGF